MARGFKKTLDHFADWRKRHRPSIVSATIEVTERYARRVLGLKKDEPLLYKGLQLRCIGSRAWRNERGAWA